MIIVNSYSLLKYRRMGDLIRYTFFALLMMMFDHGKWEIGACTILHVKICTRKVFNWKVKLLVA